MGIRVRGPGPADPFLGARDLFETEHELDRPVTVQIRDDPDERTRVSHDEDGHLLVISRQAATSAMARELALHEFAHMHHYERDHPSHTQSTEEAIFLALALVERHDLVDEGHRLYDIAHAAAQDAPGVSLEAFKRRFRTLSADPDESEYRKALVDVTRAYAGGGEQAAD